MKLTRTTGRPKLPEHLRKVRVTVTLSPVALRMIDGVRGAESRSGYIESLLPHSPEDIRRQIKEQGAIHTPSALAEYVGKKVVGYYILHLKAKHKRMSPSVLSTLRILDPACGSGELLNAAWTALVSEPLVRHKGGRSCALPDPGKVLCGIDVDPSALVETRTRIQSLGSHVSRSRLMCIQTNALFPYDAGSAKSGQKMVFKKCGTADGFDIVIANPPWGAKTDSYRGRLARNEYAMCKGQFDTADLFLEAAVGQLRSDGFLAFILPDSLFQLQRSSLREFILKNTRVMYIGRLGEKIFESVNRACVVLICQKSKPSSNHTIDCMRLTPSHRKAILAEEKTFSDAEKELAHQVSQARLLSNAGYLFNIDVRDSELKTIRQIDTSPLVFGSHLVSSRGIELSKTGNVCKCPYCCLWIPIPQAHKPTCGHCGKEVQLSEVTKKSIISSAKGRRSKPLIVGESVSRYQATVDRWIVTDKKGINYKSPETYTGEKIVVRKTGVGISASLDYSGAFTNQVVYMLKTNAKTNGRIPLEFFLGVLNSRAIYYYLVKSHGETEWRSHPYLTQQQVLGLPLPPKQRWNVNGTPIVDAISKVLRPYLSKGKQPPGKIDAQVERLVAKAFGLTRHDYRWIYGTLGEVQQLVPIRVLRAVTIDQVFAK